MTLWTPLRHAAASRCWALGVDKMSYEIKKIEIGEFDDRVGQCIADIWSEIAPCTVDVVISANRQLFHDNVDVIIVIAEMESHVVGFRIGHRQAISGAKRVFYDQNGGVMTAYRRMGIGRALIERQHELAKSLGYTHVITGTHVSLKPMIALNLKLGFTITDSNMHPQYGQILNFELALGPGG
jgi:GNAT superfamily N-acetyltransferase